MSNTNYYVYIDYRLDTNEPFYVGKGKGNRYCDMSNRNDHFINIVNSIPTVVTIVKDNLTEEEALYWEEEIIRILVFEYGYSIDIKNNTSDEKGCHLVNATWGGEGTSGLVHTEESKRKMSENRKGKTSGENHPLFGIHHSEETRKKQSEAKQGLYNGENHPLFGTHRTEETKEKLRLANNKAVICITTMEIFESRKVASKTYHCDNSDIGKCCNGKKKSCGKLEDGTPLQWMNYIDYLELQNNNNNNN